MNQNNQGHLLRCQESPGMAFDTTRLHKTRFQKVNSFKIFKILTKSWRMVDNCGRIQNLGWIQLQSTLKITRVRIENASLGYDLTYEIWISEGPGPLTGGPSDFPIMSPGGECFAP